MGERVIGSELAKKILDEWLRLTFADRLHTQGSGYYRYENANLK